MKQRKKLFYIFGSLFLAAFAAEAVIRVSIAAHMNWVAGYSFNKKMDRMLHEVWDRDYRGPLSPPFASFSDRDSSNLARLKDIYPFSRLPSLVDEKAPDFLLPAGKSFYRVRTTADGFRGDPASIDRSDKHRKEFRILCLGSYLTFGEGVDNQDIWTTRLHDILQKKLGRPVVVMNAGLNSSTAIMGLARLTFDGPRLKPDLIILQYGTLDVITGDVIPGKDPRVSGQANFIFTSFEQKHRRLNKIVFSRFLKHSYVVYNLWTALFPWIMGDPHWDDEGTVYFGQAMTRLIELSKKTARSVIMLTEPLTGKNKLRTLVPLSQHENVPLFQATELLRRHAELFQSDPPWLADYGEKRSYYQNQPMYRGILGAYQNPFQLGAAAHEIIAQELAKSIAPIARGK